MRIGQGRETSKYTDKLAVLQRYTAANEDGDTGPWRDWSDCRDKGTARLFRLQSMCR